MQQAVKQSSSVANWQEAPHRLRRGIPRNGLNAGSTAGEVSYGRMMVEVGCSVDGWGVPKKSASAIIIASAGILLMHDGLMDRN